MEVKKIESEVPKEIYELAAGIGDMALVIKAAVADGFQVGQDVPVIIAAAIQKLIPAFDGFEKVSGEYKEASLAFAEAIALVGFKVAKEIAKKPAVAVASK